MTDKPMLPIWIDGVPWCSERCCQYDGKRCRILGHEPYQLCEPAVRAMSDRLAGYGTHGRHAMDQIQKDATEHADGYHIAPVFGLAKPDE